MRRRKGGKIPKNYSFKKKVKNSGISAIPSRLIARKSFLASWDLININLGDPGSIIIYILKSAST
jgi:hypothetical protein